MAQVTRFPEPAAAAPPAEAQLTAAYANALRFAPTEAGTLRLDQPALTAIANEECAFTRVSVDEQGLTAAARVHFIEPARQLLRRWRDARGGFDVAIEPYMGDIRAARRVLEQIDTLRSETDEKKQQVERKLEQNTRYVTIRDRHETSDNRWRAKRLEHANRDANEFAYRIPYWVAMLLVGAAEWMINYDVFLLFLGVPAIAAGATVVMGLLLAFAAHAHGMLFKQFAYRFGAHKHDIDRHGDLRLFLFATFGLLIVLVAAGGSRYAAVMHSMSGLVAGNLAGADAAIDANPLRDVALSLSANIAAWGVGVFLSIIAHDIDPDYMDSAHQAARWRRRWLRLRGPADREKAVLEAQFQKRQAELKNAAEGKLEAVRAQADLLSKIERHEGAVLDSVAAALTTNVQTYNTVLAGIVISHRGETRIIQAGQDISPYDLQAHRVMLDGDFARGLL